MNIYAAIREDNVEEFKRNALYLAGEDDSSVQDIFANYLDDAVFNKSYSLIDYIVDNSESDRQDNVNDIIYSAFEFDDSYLFLKYGIYGSDKQYDRIPKYRLYRMLLINKGEEKRKILHLFHIISYKSDRIRLILSAENNTELVTIRKLIGSEAEGVL